MNPLIIDPLQGDFPEVIEEYMDYGVMKCIAFNRRGNLLAAGCSDGRCLVWDFITRGVAKVLRDRECHSAITSISWSKNGRRILVSAADKSLILWDVLSGQQVSRMTLQQTALHVRLHPGASTPSLCLACPLSLGPMIIDLSTDNICLLPVSASDVDVSAMDNGSALLSSNKSSDTCPILTPSAACFSKSGDLVYVGTSKGEILIVDHKCSKVRAVFPISGSAIVKNMTFSRDGKFLLTNSNDRVIRVYENLLPLRDELKALNDLDETTDGSDGLEKLKGIASECLMLFQEFHDSITKVHWKAPCFSGDGEWIVGGSASKGEHKIYIWNKAGPLVKILEGPNEALVDLAWHPVRPVLVSVSITGVVYIWAKDLTENWSAFAPDFKELEENEEYVEREDEFDLMPETEKVKKSEMDEDEEVDILTKDKDPNFSDSEMLQDELLFLPPSPIPEVLEEQDDYVGRPIRLEDSQLYGLFAGDAELYGQAMANAFTPLEDDTGRPPVKRKRKPSKKGLEMLAERAGKSSSPKPLRSSGRPLRVKEEIYG